MWIVSKAIKMRSEKNKIKLGEREEKCLGLGQLDYGGYAGPLPCYVIGMCPLIAGAVSLTSF